MSKPSVNARAIDVVLRVSSFDPRDRGSRALPWRSAILMATALAFGCQRGDGLGGGQASPTVAPTTAQTPAPTLPGAATPTPRRLTWVAADSVGAARWNHERHDSTRRGDHSYRLATRERRQLLRVHRSGGRKLQSDRHSSRVRDARSRRICRGAVRGRRRYYRYLRHGTPRALAALRTRRCSRPSVSKRAGGDHHRPRSARARPGRRRARLPFSHQPTTRSRRIGSRSGRGDIHGGRRGVSDRSHLGLDCDHPSRAASHRSDDTHATRVRRCGDDSLQHRRRAGGQRVSRRPRAADAQVGNRDGPHSSAGPGPCTPRPRLHIRCERAPTTSDRNADRHGHRTANSHANDHVNRNPDPHADRDINAHADHNSDTDADDHSDPHAGRDRDGDADPDRCASRGLCR